MINSAVQMNISKKLVSAVSVRFKDPGFKLTSFFSLIFFTVILGLCVYRYVNFQYHDWDFAVKAQGIRNILRGHPYISIKGMHFLGNHFNIIAFILAPLFRIFPHPLTLLFLQTLAASLVAFPVYLIARKFFDWRTAAFFPIVYFLYPSLYYTLMYEFHFETLAPFFLAFSFYFLIANKKAPFILMSILAMTCKENIPLVVAAMGLYGAVFCPKRRIVSLYVMVLAIIYFLAVTLKLQPLFTPPARSFAYQYEQYGESFEQVYVNILARPFVMLQDLFSTHFKRDFLSKTFSPLLFLPLLSPDILIISAPTFIKNLLSNVATVHQIQWHYTSTIIPFLIFSLIYSIKRLVRLSQKLITPKVIRFLLLGIIFAEIFLGHKYFHEFFTFFVEAIPRSSCTQHRQSAIDLIPDEAAVIATFNFLPKLSMRKDLYTFYAVWRGAYQNPVDVEYALFDLNDHFIRKDILFYHDEIITLFTKYLNDETWKTKFSADGIVLLKKSPNEDLSSHNIIQVLDSPQDIRKEQPLLLIDNLLILSHFNLSPVPGTNELNIHFYWRAPSRPQSLYGMFFSLSDSSGKVLVHQHPMAYFFDFRKITPGQLLKETYTMDIPADLPNDLYILSVGFVDILRRRRPALYTQEENLLNAHGEMLLGFYNKLDITKKD